MLWPPTTLASRTGPEPPPELVHRALGACRVVLHEVCRRVESTVANAAAKAELRHGVKAAESAVARSERLFAVPPHRKGSSTSGASAGAPPLSNLETQDHAGSGVSSVSAAPHHAKCARSTQHTQKSHDAAGRRESMPGATVGASGGTSASAPPHPTKEVIVKRRKTTVALSPTNAVGSTALQSSTGAETDDASRAEQHLSSSSLSGGATPSAMRPARTVMYTTDRLPFCTALQSAVVWGYVLSAIFWKRRKLTEYTITALELLLRVMPVPSDIVTLIVDPAALSYEGVAGEDGAFKGRRAPRRSGHMLVSVAMGVYCALSECIMQSFSEPAVQTRALRLVTELITSSLVPPRRSEAEACCAGREGETNSFIARRSDNGTVDVTACFHGDTAVRVIESCLKVAARGMQETARREALLALRAAVQRVVHTFVTMRTYDEVVGGTDGRAQAHSAFSTDTVLADYTTDVDNNEPYTWIHVVLSDKAEVPLPAPRCTGFSPLEPAATAAAPRSGGEPGGNPATQPPQYREGRPELVSAPAVGTSPQIMKHALRTGDASSSASEQVSNAPAPSPKRPVFREARWPSAQRGHAVPRRNEGSSHVAHTLARSQPSATAAASAAAATRLDVNPSPSSVNLSFDPHTFFRNSVDESLVLDALSTLSTSDGALPSPLKDLLIVLRRMCRYASRPCSGTPTNANRDVRERDVGLWALECVLDGLPVANCEREHRCATWLSLVLNACKYELLGCIAKNLAMATPFTLFERAVHLLGMLLRKLHYHMARELHTLLGAFLLPLMVSQYAGFRQKHAVLSMIRQLFTVPHLCVSFFVNYDCNPAFDPGAEYGGMLELLVEHVVEMTFLDHVDGNGDAYPWLSSDQQQLLRSECVVVIHTLMTSLYRWIAEDPRDYAASLQRDHQKGAQQGQQQEGGGTIGATESTELCLDSWESDEVVDPNPLLTGSHSATAAASRKEDHKGSSNSGESEVHGRDVALPLDAVSGKALSHWRKNSNVNYHWKHIHYLLHNKRIVQEAVQSINSGHWREAKEFLESRGFMAAVAPSETERADPSSVAPGTSSYALFARFLFEYPGISRGALCSIFEKVNQKDGVSRMLLQEYLHCFNYTDIPIDVAMRDTTCKFMSWDRPMFEAKVWETIQQCFGNEYAKQNPGSITARDADVMAGVLLFLHSNLHNCLVKSSRMQASQFVRDANACLEFPMMEEDLQAMFNRVLNCKWELDMYGRTPQQAEKERTLVRLSTKIQMEQAAQQRRQSVARNTSSIVNSETTAVPASAAAAGSGAVATASVAETHATTCKGYLMFDTDPAALEDVLQGADESDGISGHSPSRAPGTAATTATPKAEIAQNPNASMDSSTLQVWMSDDMGLLDNTIPTYADNKDTLKTKEEQHHAFREVSAMYLHKLESVHRLYCVEDEAYRPQPYIMPCYAEHVRQMLLLTYPHVMSCVYMGFRVLEEAPIARKLLDTVQITYDIAAAFVLNLRDLRPVMEEALQRYLDDERAYRLLPSSRATFVPFLLNVL
ncbi:Guanine nucleotide exchange factor in Golgi transport N-terminal/Sec7 domain containing protein, putative [Leishmania donovani]|uniref:Guanine nucleotide exchange factor in Golgi transport N-terminal/Sec7 domain containing protein, putative n=1 Tax=Leishmania donovani TaxID=5661 RepID=A0A3S7X5X6_LEIDO|nr:Guanine nucleotide exchange factor in Golgi transport N-terminal/Sec7 domain containing protein, putative [Leishmania donovani]